VSVNTTPLSKLTVNLGHYAENLRTLRTRLSENCGIMPVVKSDAYGLGAVPIARRAVAEGAAMLAVGSVADGVALREAGI
jgi:alanine racemase